MDSQGSSSQPGGNGSSVQPRDSAASQQQQDTGRQQSQQEPQLPLQAPSQDSRLTSHRSNLQRPSSQRLAPSQPGQPGHPPGSSSAMATPLAPEASDSASGYFEPLSRPPSQQSRISNRSISRFPSLTTSASRSSRPELARRPSIRIRASFSSTASQPAPAGGYDGSTFVRPRSTSQPSNPTPESATSTPARQSRRMAQTSLPRLTEEGPRPSMAELGLADVPLSPVINQPPQSPDEPDIPEMPQGGRLRRARQRLWPGSNRRDSTQPAAINLATVDSQNEQEVDEELVDWLDIIDPEVQTLSTLTNVQNSLFVPDLGNWLNRRPTYVLSQPDKAALNKFAAAEGRRRPSEAQPLPDQVALSPVIEEERPPRMQRSDTITSRLTDSHYAALPHGKTLEGWSAADKWELDDHVRHMLHSRRARFKRIMKGFGQYVRRPLGFLVTLYATLITLFGLAWVLFLIGWIYVGEKQVYAIHVIDSVLVALFAIMGDGLAPFRAVDTYHMFFVVRFTRMMEKAKKLPNEKKKKKKKRSLCFWKRNKSPDTRHDTESSDALKPRPFTDAQASQQDQTRDSSADADSDLCNTNAMEQVKSEDSQQQSPDNPDADLTIEDGKLEAEQDYFPLTEKQQKSLVHHQTKLAKSHSFYKPHETFTHYSFPLAYLIAIVLLLDFHSCLQISLGACTWGIDYHHRPVALTTTILCVSITANLSAGLVIMIGDRKTRKKDVMKLLNRQELTDDAIKSMEHKRKKKFKKGKRSMSKQTTEEST
ncbi:hypothetical protein CDD82_3611 [Ophiocordyceps australis]|uniref:Integral membrane protein n=1 Tax=Ophiocordyceps australis TaxID=1399860 RepID=A0A2C5ZSV5_9HYPO|nr:hypothetical protein CDD82_3611 [Ophiocordyceps australis]